jgi:DNA-binding SARP family transcriptional activator
MEKNVDHDYRFDGILGPDGKLDRSVYRDRNQEILIQNYAGSFIRLGRYAEEQAAAAADDSARRSWLGVARRRYETAYEIAPQHEAAVLLLAGLAMRSGDSSRAVSLLESLVAKDPTNDNALFELARLHLLEGRFTAALPALRRLDQRNPNDEFLQQMLLEAYWGAGQQGESERLVADWEARHPGEPGRRLRQYFERMQRDTLPGAGRGAPSGRAESLLAPEPEPRR